MSNIVRSFRTTLASLWMWAVLITAVIVGLPFVVLWRIVGRGVDPANYHGGRLFRVLGKAVVALTPDGSSPCAVSSPPIRAIRTWWWPTTNHSPTCCSSVTSHGR